MEPHCDSVMIQPSNSTSNALVQIPGDQDPQKHREKTFNQKCKSQGRCLFLILCFCLGLGLGLGLGLILSPNFGLSLGLGLGTGLGLGMGLRFRLDQCLDLSQWASLDPVHQESTDTAALEEESRQPALGVSEEESKEVSEEVTEEVFGIITDVRTISNYEYENWMEACEDLENEKTEEAEAENREVNNETKEAE